MLQGMAVLTAPQGAGQVCGEDVCSWKGQVWAAAEGDDTSKLKFVWVAEGRQSSVDEHREVICKTGEWKAVSDKGDTEK